MTKKYSGPYLNQKRMHKKEIEMCFVLLVFFFIVTLSANQKPRGIDNAYAENKARSSHIKYKIFFPDLEIHEFRSGARKKKKKCENCRLKS